MRLTLFKTSTALNTLLGVDCKGCELMTGSDVIGSCNSICRTLLCAHSATDTLIKVNLELKQGVSYACGTLLINDMSNVLISKVTKC